MSELVDSHCHLDFPGLTEDLDGVTARAHAAGIGRMVTICTRVREFPGVLAIAERFPEVFCSVGLHPHHAAEEPELDTARLLDLARHPKVVGIGETGLDYFYDESPRDVQREKFLCHIAAARETGLPLIVHTRNADEDTGDLLAGAMAEGPFTGVLHCFSSGRALAERAVELGLYISISGIVTFKNAADLRETVQAMPLDRLLVETDAPYLAPAPHRGRRNEPALVSHTAAKVAELKGIGMAEVTAATTANFERLFTRARLAGTA